jgi:MoaA/NifB/PqqE/SkfB family radical SAM enzyme
MSFETLSKLADLPIRYFQYRRFESNPLWAIFDITMRCPCACQYCTNWFTPHEQLTLDEMKLIVTRIRKMGVIYLGITGGEPLTQKGVPEMVALGKELGMLVGINTSGMIATEKVLTELMEAGINTICFSIDGSTAEIHEHFRDRCPYDRVVAAISRAVKLRDERGYETRITTSTVLHKANYHNVRDIIKLRDELGVDRSNFQPVWEVKPQPGFQRKFSFDPDNPGDRAILEDVRDTLNSLPRTNLKAYTDLLPDMLMDYENTVRHLECFAGRAFVHVDVRGNVYPCALLDKPMGSLLEDEPETFMNTADTKPVLEQAAIQDCPGCTLVCYQERNQMLATPRKPSVLFDTFANRILIRSGKSSGVQPHRQTITD